MPDGPCLIYHDGKFIECSCSQYCANTAYMRCKSERNEIFNGGNSLNPDEVRCMQPTAPKRTVYIWKPEQGNAQDGFVKYLKSEALQALPDEAEKLLRPNP